MGKSNISLMKTCASCGEQKPLSAFLQLTGKQGAVYGNVCSSCRKTQLDQAAKLPEGEDVTTQTTGVKIDSKAKVKGDTDKLKLRKQLDESFFDEREKKDETRIDRTEKVSHIAREEKKHREGFLEKQSFLDKSKKSTSSPSKIFGGEEHKAEAGKIDLASGPVDNMRVAGQIKLTQSPIYQAFKSWLGNAPIVSAAERAARDKNKKTTGNTAEKSEKDPLNAYIDQQYGPRRKK